MTSDFKHPPTDAQAKYARRRKSEGATAREIHLELAWPDSERSMIEVFRRLRGITLTSRRLRHNGDSTTGDHEHAGDIP